MAPSPPLLLLLLVLTGLGLAAAQPEGPFPPFQQQRSTNAADAAALRAVFQQWGLAAAAGAPEEDPCQKRVWLQSFATNASIDCGCDAANGECRITHLNVTGFWNISVIPPALFNLTELVSLDLSNNNLSGSIPPEVSNLSKLETWHFNNNKLSGPFPNESSRLGSLQSLWMFDNYIEGLLPEFIANFTNLTDLRIYGMKLRGPIPKNFSNLINLEKLDLRSNNLSGSIQQLLPYRSSRYLYVGENNFSGQLPSEIVQSSLAFENLTLLNCLGMKECNRTSYTNPITSFAVNCGGKQKTYQDSLPITFSDDTSNLGAAGIHVDTDKQWVVSHVGSDPVVSESPGIVNTNQGFLGVDMPELYQTARTSRSALSYYVVGLSNGKYTVQLFFAEIVIDSQLNHGPGRRLFNIDIQDQNIKTDFDITKEAGGFRRPMNITYEVTVDNPVLKIHLYWNGRGTCCIPYEGAYGPLVSAIRVFRPKNPNNIPPPTPPRSARPDNKRRGVVVGIAALCIAMAVISSSVAYLWWKWVSLVKHPNA
ncbi:hypothetical protein BRADI_1g48230v3 [Brachypodium distachyon]|uniref:non-specific serine/threonine protein kinase n=1 Tax=Brachypodium distachyon TaxID=15368 RepID=A0A0Q3JNU7_BRADI|nr:hypothetical protein BRADI_1g48230v3 [Brachypodium distachyon]